MTLPTKRLPPLRKQLLEIDAITAGGAGLAPLLARAEEVATRLRIRVEDLNRQAEEHAAPIQVDTDRVERLISGDAVPDPSRKDLEAHAIRHRLIASERIHVQSDLDAVDQRIKELTEQQDAWRHNLAEAEAAFLRSLAEAAREAYQEAAIAFVAEHIPQLQSICDALRAKTGKEPGWLSLIVSCLNVRWWESSNGTSRDVQVWPRSNVKVLHGGEPISSPDVVAGLIAAIRASGSTAS